MEDVFSGAISIHTRTHACHVTGSINYVDSLRHFRSIQIGIKIEEVQWEPRDTENQGNTYQQTICSLHSTVSSGLYALVNSGHVLIDDKTFFQSEIYFHIGRGDNHDGNEVLKSEGEDAVVDTAVVERKLRPSLLAVGYGVLEVKTGDVDVVMSETPIYEQRRRADHSDYPDHKKYEKRPKHLKIILSWASYNHLEFDIFGMTVSETSFLPTHLISVKGDSRDGYRGNLCKAILGNHIRKYQRTSEETLQRCSFPGVFRSFCTASSCLLKKGSIFVMNAESQCFAAEAQKDLSLTSLANLFGNNLLKECKKNYPAANTSIKFQSALKASLLSTAANLLEGWERKKFAEILGNSISRHYL
jgi:hypothetical protein